VTEKSLRRNAVKDLMSTVCSAGKSFTVKLSNINSLDPSTSPLDSLAPSFKKGKFDPGELQRFCVIDFHTCTCIRCLEKNIRVPA
jgi:hypothetical protein